MQCVTRMIVCLTLGVYLFATDGSIWLDVPFVRQQTNGCGAAVISMVVQYWAKASNRAADGGTDQADIQRELYAPQAHGIYSSAIVSYLGKHGFQTFAFSGKWEDLEHHLKRGRPLIVGIKPSPAGLHYVVVTGIDTEEGFLMINDPAQRKLLKEDRANFQREWNATDNWTLLALPRQSGLGS